MEIALEQALLQKVIKECQEKIEARKRVRDAALKGAMATKFAKNLENAIKQDKNAFS